MPKENLPAPDYVTLPESGLRLYLPPRSSHVPAEQWVPYPGSIPNNWHTIAKAKGFRIHSRVRDRYHLCLQCQTCGAFTAQKVYTVRTAQPACVACLHQARVALAKSAGLSFLRRDLLNSNYGVFRAPCGHKISRQFSFLERIAAGEVEHRCEYCLENRERTEAQSIGWDLVSRDSEDANYRLYQHSCGHLQRVSRTNMRWGQVDCARCGQSWSSRPSYIYLLQLKWPNSDHNLLKVGFSGNPERRFRHQFGLSADVDVHLHRTVPFKTGNDACRVERKLHSTLRKAHPDQVVPRAELKERINVVSEVYRPALLPRIESLFDRIAKGQIR